MSSAVVKAGEAVRLARSLYSLDLRDISQQAKRFLSTAQSEARRLVDEARNQARVERNAIHDAARESGFEKGYAKGREEGHAAGLAEAREQFAGDQASLVSALNDVLGQFNDRREALYLAARRDVVVLAIAIARRISRKLEVMGEVACDAAVEACEEALALLSDATEAVVRAHPDDWQAVERLAATVAASTKSSRHIRVVEDASIGRGGIVLETAESSIDAQVNSRVDRLADELVTDWRERLKTLKIES